MFVEHFYNDDFRKETKIRLINLNTGTALELCIQHVRENLTSLEVIGTPGFHHQFFSGDKSTAEALYTRIRNRWVGNDYVEVIK